MAVPCWITLRRKVRLHDLIHSLHRSLDYDRFGDQRLHRKQHRFRFGDRTRKTLVRPKLRAFILWFSLDGAERC
jgi:hypothetical protein